MRSGVLHEIECGECTRGGERLAAAVPLSGAGPSAILRPPQRTMAMSNTWCDVLKISVPRLEVVKDHREASTFSMLLVALLESGGAMTLPEVAERFEQAGVASAGDALASLKRCRPGRPPVYRDGDCYYLDPHDQELDLWAFRLGLRPPKVPRSAKPEPEPVPDSSVRLSMAELDEAWSGATLTNWSQQRLVIAVLDASAGSMAPAEVVNFVSERTRWHLLREDTPSFKRRNSAVSVSDDGRWSIAEGAGDTLLAVRKAVRDKIEVARRYAGMRSSPAEIEASRNASEQRRAAHAAELAKLRRVLLYAYPAKSPCGVALVDVAEHTVESLVGEELAQLGERLEAFDVIGALDVRGLLRALDFDPGQRRLAELGPPQKSMKVNKRGRTLKITTELLMQGSCGIAHGLGDQKKLASYLQEGQLGKARRRLEASAKSLYALYQYGRLHGAVRLRWGFIDEVLPVPWLHRDEPTLRELEKAATECGEPLEVVIGSAPGWADPWARAQLAFVEQEGYRTWLVDPDGRPLDRRDVQLARLVATLH